MEIQRGAERAISGTNIWFALDPSEERLDLSLEEFRSQWSWVSGSGYLNSEFSLTEWLAWNARPLKRAWQTNTIALVATSV